MKKLLRTVFASIVAITMALTSMPSVYATSTKVVNANDYYNIITDENEHIGYNYNSKGSFVGNSFYSYEDFQSFYVYGNYNNKWIQNGYSINSNTSKRLGWNIGFQTINDNTLENGDVNYLIGCYPISEAPNVKNLENEDTKLKVGVDFSFVSNGNLLKVDYTVKNQSNVNKEFSMYSGGNMAPSGLSDINMANCSYSSANGLTIEKTEKNGPTTKLIVFSLDEGVTNYWWGTDRQFSKQGTGSKVNLRPKDVINYAKNNTGYKDPDNILGSAIWYWENQVVPANGEKVLTVYIGFGDADYSIEDAASGLLHKWNYTKNDSVITATCEQENCEYHTNGLTASLEVNDVTYASDKSYGGEIVNNISEITGATASIKYTGRDGTEYNSEQAPSNAGKYTVSYEIGGQTISKDFEIKKANQDSPANIGVVNETIKNKKDGKITGVSNDMEYRKENETSYKNIEGNEVTNLASGKYYVRYKEDENHNCSNDLEVEIAPSNKMLKVTVPDNQEGYTLSIDKNEVEYDGTSTIKYTKKSGYTETKDFKVKVNGKTIQLDDQGKYKIHVTDDTTIIVEGVEDKTAPDVTVKVDENNFWKELVNKITFGLFFNNQKEVTIEAGDPDGSGINECSYYVSNKSLTKEQVENISDWKKGSSLSLSEEKNYVVYVKVSDKAGNVKYVSTDGLVIDKTAPTVSGIENGGRYTKSISFTVEDDNLEEVKANDKVLHPNNEGKYVLVPSDKKYIIEVTDRAGNIKTISNVEVNYQEVEKPTINNKKYTGQSIFATIDNTNEYEVIENLGGTDAGQYDVKLKLYDSVNYKWKGESGGKAEISILFEITKSDKSNTVITTTKEELDKVYDGKESVDVKSTSKNSNDPVIEYKKKGANDATYTTKKPTEAGDYTVRVTYPTDKNYNKSSTTKEFTIEKAKVTVKVNDLTKVYGDKDQELSYEVEGVIDGTPLKDITLSRKEGENVGTYVIKATQKEESNPNYAITFVDGTYTIASKDSKNAKVILKNVLRANGNGQTQEIDKVMVDGKELTKDDYDVVGNVAKESGVYTLTIKGKGNYSGECKVTYVVVPAKASQIKEDSKGNIVIGNGTLLLNIKTDKGTPATKLESNKAEIINMLIESKQLTANELSEIANGANVDVILVVKDANEIITESSKETIVSNTKGYTIGQYIDISLYKYMIIDGNRDDGEAIHETSNKIKISIEIPTELINKDSKINRTYYIVRNHDGKVEILKGIYNEETNTYTFETDRFSDYAIIYKDEAVKTTVTGNVNPTSTETLGVKEENKVKVQKIKTGDDVFVVGYVVLLVLTLIGMVFLRKKENN